MQINQLLRTRKYSKNVAWQATLINEQGYAIMLENLCFRRHVMHITLTGNLGSGKSTICKLLQNDYGFEIFSTGKVQRKLAEEMNLTVLEMNQLMCSDSKYDSMIDDATTRLAKENQDKNIVFDSRLAWHFVESSFKVFLMVSLDVAANRVMNDSRGAVESYKDFEDAKDQLAKRAANEDARYKDLYNIEYFNFNNYNLVLDSTYATPESLAKVIMEEAKKYEEAKKAGQVEPRTKILVSPKRLFACDEITEHDKELLKEVVENYKERGTYIQDAIKAKKDGDIFSALERENEVKAMILAETTFVPISL